MGRADWSGLRLRIASAVALAPPALVAVWFGGVWLAILTAFAGAVMAWEWSRLCGGAGSRPTRLRLSAVVAIATVVAGVAIAAGGATRVAVAVTVVGAGSVSLTARREAQGDPLWMGLGTLWVALPCICLVWLGNRAPGGRVILLWMLAVVWATDIGAYLIGRSLGGPRLAPRWSPRKTWAGFAGGVLCGMLVGGAIAVAMAMRPALPVALISAGLAVVAQFGDLAESLAKRRFGVKDTSGLIPGHGGLLDRLDSLLAVVPAVALLTLIGDRSLLAWQ